MTTSELAYLAVGLVIGAAIGAALGQILRRRPSARGQVRLTITPNAIPAGRTRTLTVPSGEARPVVVPGSPEDGALAQASVAAPRPGPERPAVPPTAPPGRTRVPSGPVTLRDDAIPVPVDPPQGAAPTPAPRPAGPVRDAAPATTEPGHAVDSHRPAPGPGTVPGAAGRPPDPGGPARPDAPLGPGPSAVARPATGVVNVRTGVPTLAGRPGLPSVADGTAHPSGSLAVAHPADGAGTGASATAASPVVAAVAVMDVVAPRPSLDDGFTTLVRPRPPADPPRPALRPGAVPVSPPAPPAVRVPLPETRLAPPSAPTLTRPPVDRRSAGSTLPVRTRASAGAGDRPGGAGSGHPPTDASRSVAADPCAAQRRLVEERCALADVARDQARAAADGLREAQRAYDVLRDRVDRAEAIADPRRVAAEKDRLHAAFRAATDRGATADDTELAARAWLDEINALNAAVREAQRIVEHGRAELRGVLPSLDRLAAEADAARIASENAEAGCRDARADLAECEEADARARQAPPPPPEEPHPFADVWPVDRPELPDPDRASSPGELLSRLPVITRILRGDRDARERLVAALAGGDADAHRDWQLNVSRLVDAIVGRAIEDGYLDLPGDDPFWRLFDEREARDIVGALSALGFRYDGLGGFADGRVPAARDLSLAVGYAGLDRMRIRTWPRDSEIATLYARAEVAADEWLADQAGDLSLGRMVDALGARAADLADVWNAWGRLRPALLAP